MSAENKKSSAVVTIRYCVMSYLNEIGQFNMKDYKRYAQLMIDGYTRLHMWTMQGIEVAYLTPNAANIINFPSDMIDYTAIGVNICGRLWTFTKKDDLIFPSDEVCGVLQKQETCDDVDVTDYTYYNYSDHFKTGTYVPALYGLVGGRNDNYFKVDYEKRQIQLTGDISGEVVVEYISTGISLTTSTLIPIQAVPALKAYVSWKLVENRESSPLNNKIRKEQQFGQELRLLSSFNKKFRIQEFLDDKYSTSKQTIKR